MKRREPPSSPESILLDEDLPRRLASLLVGHNVSTVQHSGWTGIKNGKLLVLAAAEFDVFLTMDRNLEFQQKPCRSADCRAPRRGGKQPDGTPRTDGARDPEGAQSYSTQVAAEDRRLTAR